MAMAIGLLAGSAVARGSGAFDQFCVGGACVVGTVDDSILLFRGIARVPGVDDARLVNRICARPRALPRTHSTVIRLWTMNRMLPGIPAF
jgi:hypothetical protein